MIRCIKRDEFGWTFTRHTLPALLVRSKSIFSGSFYLETITVNFDDLFRNFKGIVLKKYCLQ